MEHTTPELISQWFDQGVEGGSTHMLIVCDTSNNEDRPIYVSAGENPREVFNKLNNKDGRIVHEIYDLRLDKKVQLEES